jgi:formylglycine-generating enzyme required for sulfatase activity
LDAGDDVIRVLRGGSWYDLRIDARCCYRNYNFNLPDLSYDALGFRVVVSPIS